MKLVTYSKLIEVLDYDQNTGVFRWAKKVANCVKISQLAGTPSAQGYLRIRIDGQLHMAHRLAWLYVYGKWPEKFLDHIDGDRLNNSIENLRPATASQNQHNKSVGKHNKLGIKGVSRQGRKFRAMIRTPGKHVTLGLFDTAEEAKQAYDRASAALHGDFAVQNRVTA